MKNLIILASGTGSNAKAIIEYFENNEEVKISYVLSNNPQAKVLEMAEEKKVPTLVFGRKELYDTDEIFEFLIEQNPDLIVLAGFLWIIPEKIVEAFPDKIINIHPSLLPKYGGKGMYGSFVHQAVLENKEKETGISIHYVNEEYDEGALIFQKSFAVDPEETPDSLVDKIHALEHEWFPQVIESILSSKKPETADGQKE